MQNQINRHSEGEPLLRRLRRMGLVLTGDQKLADSILTGAFTRARAAYRGSRERLSPNDIFQLGFDAFDDAVHRKGVVVILTPKRVGDGSLQDQVNQLTYVERVSISLLVIEGMLPSDAAILSGRPMRVLQNALASALSKLDDDQEPGSE